MWPWSEHLKLGKASAFVKRDLRLLPLTDAEFEADFFLDRGFSTKRREAWMGMVIEREFGALLAVEDVQWPPPTVNDLATLVAHAMLRPPHYEDRQRPRTIYLRDRPQWHELLPHLRQLGVEVVLGDDLPWFDEAAIEWMQERSARHGPRSRFSMDKIKADLKSPFPKRKRTSVDVVLALLRWTDEMLKAGYPSARRGTPAAYDPMSTVAIHLTVEELQAIVTETDIARTKKLRPRLEALVGTEQALDLSVDEWGQVLFSLCGGTSRRETHVRRHLLGIAGKIVKCLSKGLNIPLTDLESGEQLCLPREPKPRKQK
jgi:hypothetical protein